MVSNLVWLTVIVFCGSLFAGFEISNNGKTRGLGLDAGYVMPSGNNFSKSMALGVNLFYSLSNQFRVELKATVFAGKVENDPEGISAGTLAVIPLQLSIQYRLRISPRFIPYVGAGVGYYLNQFSLEGKNNWEALGYKVTENYESVIGYHFGTGIDYFIKSKMVVNIDVRYAVASFKGSYSITELVSGISRGGYIKRDLNYLSFGTGIKFLF